MRITCLFNASLVLLAAALTTGATASAQDFSPYENFPSTAVYGVVGTALPNGRLILWNGDAIFIQDGIGRDAFTTHATGYAGDPAFMALSPDGHTLLLGAGGFGGDPYLDQLYTFDANNPVDFSPSAIALTRTHFSGLFLTEHLILIDAGTPAWASELVVLDLNAKSAPVTVVVKPKEYTFEKGQVVDKPGYSANLTIDRSQQIVYAMDAATLELRAFSAAALINAFNTGTPLGWAADGVLVGTPGVYFSDGVSGITPEGYLVIGGSLGWGLPGGIQLVDPATGAVAQTLLVDGDGYTKVIYNEVTGVITALASGLVYAQGSFQQAPPQGSSPQMPALGGTAAAILCISLALALRRKTQR